MRSRRGNNEDSLKNAWRLCGQTRSPNPEIRNGSKSQTPEPVGSCFGFWYSSLGLVSSLVFRISGMAARPWLPGGGIMPIAPAPIRGWGQKRPAAARHAPGTTRAKSADLLDHLRGPGPHARGCWAVDAVLGKG